MMSFKLKTLFFFLILWGFWANPALTQCPSDRILERQFYRAQDFYVVRAYQQVKEELLPLLKNHCFKDQNARQLARIYLGIALLNLGDRDRAEFYILQMLKTEPDIEINPSIASPDDLAFIQNIREKFADELERIRREENTPPGRTIDNFWLITEIKHNVYWINFLPFGIGDMQNNDWSWALGLGSAQLLALSLHVSSAWMVEVIRGKTYRFTHSEAVLARRWQSLQMAGGIAFFIFYAWSVAHSLWNYQPEIRTVLPPTNNYPEDLFDATSSYSQVHQGVHEAFSLIFPIFYWSWL